MNSMLVIVPVLGICALLFAAYQASTVTKRAAGTERMQEIAAAISEGAHAFLFSEYRILIIFVGILFVLIGLGIGNCCAGADRCAKGCIRRADWCG